MDLCKHNNLKGTPDLALKAMSTMECFETGSSLDTCKAKSVRERWIGKSDPFALNSDAKPDSDGNKDLICIERDCMLLHNVVETGEDKRKAIHKCFYRVVSVCTKQYNKWFMAKK